MTIARAVIPAAGRGLRMMPASRAVSKELLPLVDRPLIHYLAVEACLAGVRELVFVVGSDASPLPGYFQPDPALAAELRKRGLQAAAADLELLHARGVSMRVVRQAHPRGLGDAILCARAALHGEPFGILLPDVVLHPLEAGLPALAAEFQASGDSVVLLQRVANSEVRKYGIVDAVPRPGGGMQLRSVVEKPAPAEAPSDLALVGRYLFTPAIFPLLERTTPGHGGELQLTDALAELLQQQPVRALECRGEVHDCGHAAGYTRAFVAEALRRPELREMLRELLGPTN